MKHISYIHRYIRGSHIPMVMRVPVSFDAADRHAAHLATIYGPHGWSYEVSDSMADPRAKRRQSSDWTNEDPELRSLLIG